MGWIDYGSSCGMVDVQTAHKMLRPLERLSVGVFLSFEGEAAACEFTYGYAIDMSDWQGQAHGAQEITVSLEISFGSPPTSIARGYTGE